MNNKKIRPTFLIGHPVSHSKSPMFQNAAFKKCGINSIYLAIDINPLIFTDTIKELKKMDILGMNITLPFKIDIIEFIDELSPEAKIINSVNTVKISKGKWFGYNTDWFGFYKTLENNNIKNNLNVLIIGAGGATSGVIYGLKEYGIKDITLINRTFSKAEILKKQYQLKLLDFQNINDLINDFSMIINCTTLNFKELLNKYNDNSIYFDLKYYSKTENIKNFIDGSLMLLHQGAKSFSIWTGKEAPIDIMKKALFEKKD
jgi:shikimate dehydrogenase